MTIHLNRSASRLAQRDLLPFLHDVAIHSGHQPWINKARRLIELFTPPKPSIKKRASKKAKKLSASGDREAHRLETAAIREEVFRRAGGVCEFCGQSNHPCAATELHHLESGIGRRRQLQAVYNCVAICRLCHRGYHKRPEEYRNLVVRWTGKHGYPVPLRFRRPPRSAALSVGAR